jgi:iron complex outermembrane receptor protein
MRGGRRRLGGLALRGGAAVAAALVSTSCAYASDERHRYDLRPADLADTLRAVAKTSGSQLLFAPELVAGRRAPALRGQLSVEDALQRLLKPSRLSFRRTGSGVVVIIPSPARSPSPKPFAPPDAGRSPQEPAAAIPIEEVVVTSGKRPEALERVAASVLVVTADTLERAGVRDFEDLIKLAPSLTITKTTQPANSSINIRGFGTYAYSIATEASVAVVVDDIPQSFQAAALTALTDAHQVEILRGPQSTLFGKTASAGVIYITTGAPGDTLQARAEAQVTSDHEHRLQAMISGPLGDKVGLRVAANYSSFRGNIHNLSNGEWLNGQSDTNLRAKLVWTLSPDWTVSLSPYITRTLSTCCVGADILLSPDVTFGQPRIAQNQVLDGVRPREGNRQTRLDVNARGNSLDYGGGLKVARDVSGLQLASISAYSRYYLYDRQDTDASALDFSTIAPGAPVGGSANGGYFKVNAASQEFRVTSTTRQARYVAGLYLSRTSSRRYFVRGSNTLDDYNGLDALPTTNSTTFVRYLSRATSTNVAMFGQGSLRLAERLDLLAGLRLSREDIHYKFFDLGNGINYGDPECSTASPSGLTISTCDDDTAVTGRVGLQFAARPNLMTFLTYARGYKGLAYDLTSTLTTRTPIVGGPQDGVPVADAIAAKQPIASETVDNYEMGFKASLPDRGLAWNLTAFRQDFAGFQAQSRDSIAGANVLNSIGRVTVHGLETELSARLGHRLQLTGAAAYNKGVMRRFPNAICYLGQTAAEGCVAGRQDLSGKPLPNAPVWSVSALAGYQTRVGNGWSVFANAGYRWQSKVVHSLLQDPDSVQRAYGVADLSLGLGKDGLRVTAFVNNVFDQIYVLNRGRDVQWNFDRNATPPSNAVHWKPARDGTRHFGLRVSMTR